MTQQELLTTLSQMREEQSITRYQMAKHCHVTWQRLDEIEKCKHSTTLKFVFAYLSLLHRELAVHNTPIHTQQEALDILLAEYKKQIEICRHFGLGHMTINNLIQGKSNMSLATFLKLFPNPEII